MALHERDELALLIGQDGVALLDGHEHRGHHAGARTRRNHRDLRTLAVDHGVDLGELVLLAQLALGVAHVLDATDETLDVAALNHLVAGGIAGQAPVLVEVEHPGVLLLALCVHVRAPTGGLGLAALTDEVIVRARHDADALHVADEVEHEGEVVPERGAEADAQALDALAQEQLVPGRIQLVLVEQAKRRRAKLLLRLVHGVRAGLELRGVLVRVAVVRVDVEAGNRELQAVFLGKRVHLFQHARLDPVVRVHEHDVRAARAVERVVAGRRGAAVLAVVHRHADVAVCDGVQNLPGAVRRAIVHHQELEVAKRLVLQALDGTPHISVHVVRRHDDRYSRRVRNHSASSPNDDWATVPRDAADSAAGRIIPYRA